MLWSVGARFGFDGMEWPLDRLRFWYRGHVALVDEESAAIAKAKERVGGN